MRYLITGNVVEPFLTNWYDYDNNYNSEYEMVVYDLFEQAYTTNGKDWKPIPIDHL